MVNPLNWREHPAAQVRALGSVLDKVGWVQDVVVNRTTGNMVDGHLRARLALERGEAAVLRVLRSTNRKLWDPRSMYEKKK